jgi:hypothetical protein
MASRLQFDSVRALLIFIGFLLVFGILVELDKGSGIINYALRVLLWAFLLIGSVVILIRMWRTRGRPAEFWNSAHGGQIAILPPKWRRWVLGEDDPR